MPDLDTEWLEALEIEPTGDDAGGDINDNHEEDNETKEDKSVSEDKGSEEDDRSGGESAGRSDGNASAGEGGTEAGTAKEAKAQAASQEENGQEAPVLDPKQAVKEAIQEIESSRQERFQTYEGLKQEVAKTLYPEGIDRTLRDSDGDPINGIDDLVELINPKTGDYFTEEEAGAWLLAAQQKLNQDVETVERFIEQVAETNLNLTEGAKRVADKYAPILSQDPALKQRLMTAYNNTLIKDPNTGVALRAPVDVEEFFSLALDPVIAAQAAQAEAAKAETGRKAKATQGERGDLKPSGKAETAKPEDKEWAEAIKSYEQGV